MLPPLSTRDTHHFIPVAAYAPPLGELVEDLGDAVVEVPERNLSSGWFE